MYKAVLHRIGRHVLVCSLAVLGGTAVVAFAFTEPSVGPTGGTVYAPVNTGGTAQTKSGNFTSSGTLTGSTVNGTSSICLSGSCISSWSVGDITAALAGTGMSGGGLSGDVTLSLNTGGISTCTNATTNKIYWSGSQLACGTDQTGAGSITGSGSANYISKWTGASSLGNSSQIYDNGTNVGIGTTNPDVRLTVAGGHISVWNGDVWLGAPVNGGPGRWASQLGGTQSPSPTGYMQLGSVWVQWGSAVSTIDTPQTFSFPISFSTVYNIQIQKHSIAGDTGEHGLPISSWTNSNFTVDRWNGWGGTQFPFFWMAIGN